MKYYKLSMDMTRENDIVCHFPSDMNISQNELVTGKYYDFGNDEFEAYYVIDEGNIWTDYLANDKGWFLVSYKLRGILESLNSDIQFLKIKIKEQDNNGISKDYYVANVLRTADALCLEKSKYFETYIEGMGTIYTVSKYGIYANRTDNSDVFKLKKRQQIPVFVSEKFKKLIELEMITGISLTEIAVAED